MMDMLRHRGHGSPRRWLFLGLVALSICAGPAAAQQTADGPGRPTPWTHLNYLNDPNEFQFAIVSDRAANPREGVFEAALAKLNLLRPEFVLSIGDFIHGYGKWVKDGNKYFRLATTGGQSALGGPEAGQFDHVVWITMTDRGPILCNLLLEGILDEDAKSNMPEKPAN